MFTLEELQNFNLKMLQKGAPVELDNIGYNSFDYNTGAYLADNLTSGAKAASLANLLIKYCNTQLGVDPMEMRKTVAYFQENIAPIVFIHDIDEQGIWCKWEYNKSIKSVVDSYNKTLYKWNKAPDGWRCRINYCIVEQFEEKLRKLEINTEYLQEAIKNNKDLAEKALLQTKAYEDKLAKGELATKVERLNYDQLKIEIDWSNPVYKTFQEAIKSMRTMYWSKVEKAYLIDLCEIVAFSEKLNNLGVSVDSLDFWVCQMTATEPPNMKDFSYLSRQPYDFQVEDVETMLQVKSLILGNDMGCGKTFESVMVGESLDGAKLVVCPASLRLNWRKEILMVNPQARVQVLLSSGTFDKESDWTIIGYNSVADFKEELAYNFNTVFIDEAHFIKALDSYGRPASNRAEATLYVAKTAEFVYPVTGTPITNKNKDIYNLLKLIKHPCTLGNYAWNNFSSSFCLGGWNGTDGSTNSDQLHEIISPFLIRHLKSEVLPDLKLNRMFIPCEVDLREYNYEIDEYLKHRENKEAEQLARLTRARLALAKRKIEKSAEFARELLSQDEQVVIVTCFKVVVEQLTKILGEDNVCKIVGGMSDLAKDKSVTDFQAGNKKVIIMNVVAGGVGLTLTAARTMIINDYPWTAAEITQAEARICRSGQTELCTVYNMYAVGAEIDEQITSLIEFKQDNFNTAIDGGEGEEINYRDSLYDMLEKKAIGMGFKPVLKVRKQPVKRPVIDEPSDMDLRNELVVTKVSKTIPKAKSTANSTSTGSKYKTVSLEDLKSLATSRGITWKEYNNDGITRMHITMALKKLDLKEAN